MSIETNQRLQWWANAEAGHNPAVYAAGMGIVRLVYRHLLDRAYLIGQDKLDNLDPGILVIKHNSIFEHGLVSSAIDPDRTNPVLYLGDNRFFDNRALGFFTMGLGGYPLSRVATAGWSNLESHAAPMVRRQADNGGMSAIYIEGRVGKDTIVGRTYEGAARLALATSLNITPVALAGNDGGWSDVYGSTAVVAIGDTIMTANYEDPASLMIDVRSELELVQHGVALPASRGFINRDTLRFEDFGVVSKLIV